MAAPPPLGVPDPNAQPAQGGYSPPPQQPYPPQQAWGQPPPNQSAPYPPPQSQQAWGQPPYDPNNQQPYGQQPQQAPYPPASYPPQQPYPPQQQQTAPPPPPPSYPPPHQQQPPYGQQPNYSQPPPVQPQQAWGAQPPPPAPYNQQPQPPPQPGYGYSNPFGQQPAPPPTDTARYYDPNQAAGGYGQSQPPPPPSTGWGAAPPVDQYSQHPPQQPAYDPDKVPLGADPYNTPPPAGSGGYSAPPPASYPQQQPGYGQAAPPYSGQQQQQAPYNAPPAYQYGQQPPQGYGTPGWAPAAGGGNRKALLIGINYVNNAQLRLKGCVRDVEVMSQFISQRYGFNPDPNFMRILVDDQYHGAGRIYGPPTKMNIIQSFQWLTSGVSSTDQLFFQFSGHGSQLADQDNDEADGMDETIIPADYTGSPNEQIRDDVLFDTLVAPLPQGCKLTSVMDCCHSGTGMDLPYIFTATDANMSCFANGIFDPNLLPSMLFNHKAGVNKKLLVGGLKLLAKFAGKMAAGNGSPFGNLAIQNGQGQGGQGSGGFQEDAGRHKHSMGHVVLISGCDDSQTSADLGTKGGACTNSLIEVLTAQPEITIIQMLEQMRVSLKNRGLKQIPQLSSTHQLKLDAKFVF